MKEFDIVFVGDNRAILSLTSDIPSRADVETLFINNRADVEYVLYRRGLLILTLKESGESIVCHNLVLSSAVSAVPGMFERDEKGKIITSEDHSVKNVPNIYVVGKCCDRPETDRGTLKKIADHIIAVNGYRGN